MKCQSDYLNCQLKLFGVPQISLSGLEAVFLLNSLVGGVILITMSVFARMALRSTRTQVKLPLHEPSFPLILFLLDKEPICAYMPMSLQAIFCVKCKCKFWGQVFLCVPRSISRRGSVRGVRGD